jgi:hypothetical protein
VKANNRKLESKVKTLEDQLRTATETLRASQESIEALKEFNSAANRKMMKDQLSETKTKLVEAKRENDPEAEIELQEQYNREAEALKEAEKEAVDGKKNGKAGGGEDREAAPPNPEFEEWKAENEWFGTDRRRTALANAIADELRSNPEMKNLKGKKFLDRVTEEVEKALNPGGTRRQVSKVEGEGRGSGGEGGGGDDKTYSDLPADAKAACERQAARLVGQGRAFKTIDEWRKHYTAEFYSG